MTIVFKRGREEGGEEGRKKGGDGIFYLFGFLGASRWIGFFFGVYIRA